MSQKNNPEDEYFARIDAEQKAALKAKMDAEATKKAAQELRDLHYGRCGRCGNAMKTQIFKGVEIDVCPNCNAVLLDPGELEELVGEDQSGVISTISEFFSFSKKKA